MEAKVSEKDLDGLAEAMNGTLTMPGDDGWDLARQAWNLTADQHPAAVALPEDADDVRTVVRFARENGLRVAPQGTGHGATTLGDLGGSILLKTTRLGGVEVDPGTRSRPRRRRGALRRRDDRRRRARPRRPLRIRSRCRPRRLLARWRHRLAGAKARPAGERGAGGRAGERRGRAGPRRRRERDRPVLGAARRWRRRLRRRHRDRVRDGAADRRLRRQPRLALGAKRGGAEALGAVGARGAGGDHDLGPRPPVPADPRRARGVARPPADHDRRRPLRRRGRRRRGAGAASRARSRDRHLGDDRRAGPRSHPRRPRAAGAGGERPPADVGGERRDGRGAGRGRRAGIGLAAAVRRVAPARRRLRAAARRWRRRSGAFRGAVPLLLDRAGDDAGDGAGRRGARDEDLRGARAVGV